MTKLWTVLVIASLTSLLALFAPAPVARADIFQWQYINPANPGLGKQQSAILTPDGAGANAVPGAYLPYRNLTKAYLSGSNLAGANLTSAGLVNAELSQSNLANAYFGGYWESTPSEDIWHLGADFTGANLGHADLTHANLYSATLLNADLRQANLSNTSFHSTNMTGANLTGADVRGTNFARDALPYPIYDWAGGITLTQLYSTASYQAGDLNGIGLRLNDLHNGFMVGQNLTNADFSFATLNNANISQANLTNTDFYGATLTGTNLSQANLSNADLGNAMLDNADLSQANLANAKFGESTLTGANFTGAEVRGTNFIRLEHGTGIALTQLYATASYQARDLTGIGLFYNNLTGANLAGQNLTNANLVYATLTNANLSQANLSHASFTADSYFGVADLSGANLSQANLTDAYFGGSVSCGDLDCAYLVGANLTNANLSGADARGATFYLATLSGANTSNLIQSNGHIAGLDLVAGASLVVRDYDGNAAVAPIVVDQHLAMNASGTLRLVFDADPWDSLIHFAAGIPVVRSGMLELTFAPDVNLVGQIGRTIDLFDWTGVTPTGTFTISSPYTWNLSKLYTTGEVTLTAVPQLVPGDYNGNGIVGPEDYDIWKSSFGSTTNLAADGNGNHVIDAADYSIWRDHLGQSIGAGSGAADPLLRVPAFAASLSAVIPEPSTILLSLMAVAGCFARRTAMRML